MSLRFNMLLEQAGIDPAQVRLLRHQPMVGGRSLADAWRADPAGFEAYQRDQAIAQRASFSRPYWASFIGTWDGGTLFVGLYRVGVSRPIEESFSAAISGMEHGPGLYDRYDTELTEHFAEYRGRLYVEWGGGASGKRAWVQKAEAQDKPITELRLDAIERPFPGLMQIALPLSALADCPAAWRQALATNRGIYLLTCPRDGRLYVGKTEAEGGFWARWSEYRANGHGGNVALIGRDRSDFIVSVLEVAGSTATSDDILAAEAIWKRKLQSRELGLNRN